MLKKVEPRELTTLMRDDDDGGDDESYPSALPAHPNPPRGGYQAGPRLAADIEDALDEAYECTWTRAVLSSCADKCAARCAGSSPQGAALRVVVVGLCLAVVGGCMYFAGVYSLHAR
jgi:hypothetical protein